MCGTNTRSTVFYRLIRYTEFTKVMSNHFRLRESNHNIPKINKMKNTITLRLYNLLTLISTWLNVFPLYTPTILPTISGTMIMFRKCVFTTSGFSPGTVSFFAFLNFFTKAIGLRFRPRLNRLRALECMISVNCSLERYTIRLDGRIERCNRINWETYAGMSKSWSKSTPLYVYFLKVRRFFCGSSP